MYMLIGGVVSTILLVIPCVKWVAFCCFCIGVGAGSYLAFRMWIRSPHWLDEPKGSSGDAVTIGMGAGVIAAILKNLLMWVLGMLAAYLGFGPSPAQRAMYMDELSDMYRNAGIDPSFVEYFMSLLDSDTLASLVGLSCIDMVLFGIFGAIWALIGASLFHKDQLA